MGLVKHSKMGRNDSLNGDQAAMKATWRIPTLVRPRTAFPCAIYTTQGTDMRRVASQFGGLDRRRVDVREERVDLAGAEGNEMYGQLSHRLARIHASEWEACCHRDAECTTGPGALARLVPVRDRAHRYAGDTTALKAEPNCFYRRPWQLAIKFEAHICARKRHCPGVQQK